VLLTGLWKCREITSIVLLLIYINIFSAAALMRSVKDKVVPVLNYAMNAYARVHV
jgi:hypothetical protein